MLPTVRDATAADAESIARVARASWTDTYRDIFEPEFIEEFLSTNYATDALAAQAERAAARDDRHFLVAELDGAVIAFAQYGRGPRGPELFRIYAEPARFGMGAGFALLEELTDAWRVTSTATWSMCTRATNAVAPSTTATASSSWAAAPLPTAT